MIKELVVLVTVVVCCSSLPAGIPSDKIGAVAAPAEAHPAENDDILTAAESADPRRYGGYGHGGYGHRGYGHRGYGHGGYGYGGYGHRGYGHGGWKHGK